MESEPSVRTIDARVHGRYLLRCPRRPPPWPVLFGFHGYRENASMHIEALERLPASEHWLVVAVQALHPFYTRDERVVASWMTRQDRELAIADNLDYVSRVVRAVRDEFPLRDDATVFAGFSQGGAMAYRAAAHLSAAGVIVLAADVPPDVRPPHRLASVLIGRGNGDPWYTEEKMAGDLERLRALDADVDTCVFDGGHEWTEDFVVAASTFLTRLLNH